MRTKTLLLAAVLAALGSASSLAQVYSVNAVGYINVSLAPGFNIIANQLNNGQNLIGSFLAATAVPDGTTIYKYNTTSKSFETATAFAGAWLPADLPLNPGEGAIVSIEAARSFTLVGEVPQGTLNVPIAAGFNLVSSAVPQAADPATIGLVPQDGDAVYVWNNATTSYQISTWFLGSWQPSAPVPKVGEGFWLSATAAGTWTRSFSVNTP